MAHNQPMGSGRAGNAEVAQQWIEYLQKKNSILNLVWSVMLVIILILSVASFFFYHQYQTSLDADQIKLNKISEMTVQRDDWRDKAMNLETEALQLSQEIELLQTVKHSLEQQKGESVELLEVKDNLLAELKIQLTEVEKHNLELNRSLLLSQKEQAEYKQSAQRELISLKGKQGTEISTLRQQLKDRKVAFEALAKRQRETRDEMDRLSELLANEQSALGQLRKEREILNQSLSESKQQIAQVQAEYEDLERKFEFAIAPISPNKSASTLRPTAAGQTTKPITQESKQKNSTSSHAFDFNSIAID